MAILKSARMFYGEYPEVSHMTSNTTLNSPCVALAMLSLAFWSNAEPRVFASGDHATGTRTRMVVCSGKVDDHAVVYLVDTGASGSAVDERILHSLKIAPVRSRSGITPSGAITVREYAPVRMEFGGLPPKSVQPVGLDFSRIAAAPLIPFNAIAGLDVLSDHVLVVSNGIVSLRTTAPLQLDVQQEFRTGPDAVDTTMIPVSVPRLNLSQISIDTGESEACRLEKQHVAILRKNRLVLPGPEIHVANLKGAKRIQCLILREMTLGGVTFRNVPLIEANDNAIGLGILRHLELVLDFPHHRIVVSKAHRDTVDYFPQDASGVRVAFDQTGLLRVTSVLSNSSASNLGIHVGDEVLQLQDKRSAELPIREIDEILAQDGRTIPVRLRREGEEFEIQLPLKLPFQYPPNWESIDKDTEGFERFLKEQESMP